MTEKNPTKINIGKGILKPGTRPLQVVVDGNGEYWLCDADADPKKDLQKEGCTAYSSVPMAEGG